MNKKNIEAIYGLSPTQEGMLFHTIYSPKSGVYFQQYVCTLSGALNIDAFKQAWDEVVKRNAVLRTLFTWEKRPNPLQIVREKVELAWQQEDWQDLTEEKANARLEAFLDEDQNRGFNLDKAPLMRFKLIRLSEYSYRFIWSFHHLILDGWSMLLVLKEVFSFYDSFGQGQTNGQHLHKLPPARHYRDYIVWLQKQDLSRAEIFFKNQLNGFTSTTRLPFENRSPKDREGYAQQESVLNNESSENLQAFAKSHGLTLNTLIQGAWSLLLSRYTGEDDVLYGTTVTNRPSDLPGIENTVGLFINTLPARVQIDSDTSIVSWLKKLQSHQIETREYEYTPLVQIRKWSEIPAGQPLFESLVVFENLPLDAASDNTGSLEINDVQYLQRSNFPLALLVVPGNEIQLILIYDKDKFEHDTITQMFGHLTTLLSGFVSEPEGKLSELSILTAEERQQILVDWNDTHADFPSDLCMHQLIEQQVQQNPNSTAVIFSSEKINYGDLNRRANQLANYLQSAGVGPNVRVALCLDRSIEMIVSILAVLKAGGAYVPIDPTYPSERQLFMIENTNAPVLITTKHIVEKQQLAADNSDCKIICLDVDAEIISSQPEVNPEAQIKPDELAYIIHTSGSTGKPKGVKISHRNLVHSTHARMEYYPDQIRAFLLLSSYAFDSSVAGIFWTLCQGGTLVLSPARIEQDMTQLSALISENQISHMLCLPSLYNLILEHVDSKTLQSLKTIMVAGEACTGEVVKSHHSLLPETKLYNEYGPTEGTVWCTVYEATEKLDNPKVPIGRPIANMKALILDQHRNPVPVGVPGELYIGGEGLASGYLNHPELTEERFIDSDIQGIKGTRLYRTGDLVRYLPDGNIEFMGRVDDQIKIRGYRVELKEIESALTQHTGIQKAAVIANDADNKSGDAIEATLSQLISMIEADKATDLLEQVEGLSEEAVEMLLLHGS